MDGQPRVYSEFIKFPQIRVVAYQLPDGGGYVVEAINAGAIGHGDTLETAWQVFTESLEGLYELALESHSPMTFEPRSDDNELFVSFAETGPRRLPDGRMLWFVSLLNRQMARDPASRV